MIWFPHIAWFSVFTYLPSFLIFQTVLLIGVPQIVTGILAARIGRTLKIVERELPLGRATLPGSYCSSKSARLQFTSRYCDILIHRRNNERLHPTMVKSRTSTGYSKN